MTRVTRIAVAVVGLVVTILTAPHATAQVLTLKPDCGLVGDPIHVGGSGWQPQDPQKCYGGQQYYAFYLDNTEVAPKQYLPTGLNVRVQPSTTFTIPSGTSLGQHPVRVELWSNRNPGGWTMIQCMVTNLCVRQSAGHTAFGF